MALKNSTKVKVALRVSVKTAIIYSSLGMATGAICCFIILFVNNLFKTDDVYAGEVSGKISTAQETCLGDSIQLSAEGGTIYKWTPSIGLSNPNIGNPKASPDKTTTYSVSIYKSLGNLINESGRYSITSEMLSGSEKYLFNKNVNAQPGKQYLITFQARTLSYMDRGIVDVRINGKSVGTYNFNNRFLNPFEFVFDNKKDEEIELSIILKSYDGDGEQVEVSEISLRPLAITTLNTVVEVDKNCSECLTPSLTSTKVLDINTVQIAWNKITKGETSIRFKKVGEQYWKYEYSKKSSFNISKMDADFDYEFQLMGYCDKKRIDSSAWSSVYLLKSTDRKIADVISQASKAYRGVLFPINIQPDSFNLILQTAFDVDSPSDKVKLEVWNDKGQKFYSNYLPIENGKVSSRLNMNQALSSGKYMVRILDGEKSYNNQFMVQ
jgi:hypothetical protein